MRMTHKGRPLTYQAIDTRPLRVPSPPKIALPQRPVTPTHAHPWRKRLLPEGTRHRRRRASHNPEISTLGERGHF